MADFLSTNGWTIFVAVLAVAGSYAVYGYRIRALEKAQERNERKFTALDTAQTDIKVALAKIQTDIEYIKLHIK